MSPNNPSPYDFFLKDAPPPKRSLVPSNTNLKQRLMIVGGAGLILIIVLWLFFGVIVGRGPNDIQALTGVTQRQAEVIRIATIGTRKSKTGEGRNLATNIVLVVTSEQKDILKLLGDRGQKPKPSELLIDKNPKIDQALTTAEQDNRFDEAFTKAIQDQLTAYQEELQKAFKATPSQKTKKLLSTDFQQVNLLLGRKD